ncbi:hypothetical protein BDQ17DRAFT_1295352 [Cyathus striatus]|nr:hypothetical protein BDQ17DRAFT_1295352 [Cyathus striatus]
MLLQDTIPMPNIPTRTLCDRLAPYACYAMVLLYGPKVQDTINELETLYNRITVFKTKSPADLIWSFSTIQNGKGAVVRIAGLETEIVKKWLKQALLSIESIIGTDVYRQALA